MKIEGRANITILNQRTCTINIIQIYFHIDKEEEKTMISHLNNILIVKSEMNYMKYSRILFSRPDLVNHNAFSNNVSLVHMFILSLCLFLF